MPEPWHAKARPPPHPAVVAYLDALDPDVARLCHALRRRILAADPAVTEALHYGTPFFFRNAPLAYLSIGDGGRFVTLGFPQGMLFEADGLVGTGRSLLAKAAVPGPSLPPLLGHWLAEALRLDRLA